jgi:predicted  nucleic acid-binding Zn-ribbon protein
MGNFIGSCSKKEYDIQIDQLSAHLKISNKTLQRAQNNNKELTDEIRSLNEQVDILEKKALKLSGSIKHYDEILGSASVIADSIIESDLNCKWMDDDKEKEYISSIVEFIHVACNDITCGFASTKKHVKKRSKTKKLSEKIIPKLKKLDTIDKLMIEIEQTQFDSSINTVSLP